MSARTSGHGTRAKCDRGHDVHSKYWLGSSNPSRFRLMARILLDYGGSPEAIREGRVNVGSRADERII